MSHSIVKDGDWEIETFGPYEQGQNISVIGSRSRRGTTVEISTDSNDEEPGLTVSIDEGSGYMSQHCSAFIPLSVLKKLIAVHESKAESK